jgi:putative transposase
MTGDVEEAILEMYLSGISTRKVAGITDALSKVRVGKDALSRNIASGLEEHQKENGASAHSKRKPTPIPLPRRYVPEGPLWGARVSSLALLACVGVDEEGFREVLAVEVDGSEKGAAYASLLRGLPRPGPFRSASSGGFRRSRGKKGGGLR